MGRRTTVQWKDLFPRITGPRAKNFQQYEWYEFLRQPELRPRDHRDEKTVLATIEDWARKLDALQVNAALSGERRSELAAIVLDFASASEGYSSCCRLEKQIRESYKYLGKRGLARFEKWVQQLKEFADSLPDQDAFASGARLKDQVQQLEAVAVDWGPQLHRNVEAYIADLKASSPHTDDPTDVATAKLYWFFVLQCSLPGRESEIRVAKIGNSLFGWKVKFRDKYGGEDRWRGSTTIRQRIARFTSLSTTSQAQK